MFKVQATEFKGLGATSDKWGKNEIMKMLKINYKFWDKHQNRNIFIHFQSVEFSLIIRQTRLFVRHLKLWVSKV
jgi:hypothetical protein